MAELDRRSFLGLTAWLGLGVPGLAGCGGAPTPGPTPPAPKPPDVDLWEAARASVRQSPDHLVARAQEMVEAKDAEAIFAFVRDRIALLPGNVTVSGMPHREIRCGPRGTLRGGAGTAMQIAHLLADLLNRAGFEAEAMRLGEDLSVDRTKALLFTPPPREEALGPIPGLDLPPGRDVPLDQPPPEVEGLVKSLSPLLDPDPKKLGKPWDFTWKGGTPVVRLGGEEGILLNPFVPGDAGFDYQTSERVYPLRDGYLREISFALLVETTDEPGNPIRAVEATFTTDQLAGRQVVVHAEPTLPPSTLRGMGEEDVSVFLPTIYVQSLDGEEAIEPVVGEPLHTSGRTITMDEEGVVTVGGVRQAQGESGALARVVALEATVDPSRFPDVDLKLVPRDAEGKVVTGLLGGDFVVTEEERPRLHLLRSNVVSPKIILLADTSLSMPSDYRGKAGKAFFDGLAAKIVEVLPGARVQTRFTSSNIWTHLAEAAHDAPSLLVYATDGHVNDDGTPAIRRTLKAGPKAIVVDVSGRSPAILAEIAAATGGARVEASDAEAFQREVVQAAKMAPPTGYDLTYTTRSQGPDRRRLVVATRDGRHRQTLAYVVPPENERAVGSAILGLHLEVKMERRQSITPIAGAPYRTGGKLDEDARRRAAREARRGLYAKAMVSLEAGMPSRTQLADDFLTARLTRRDLHGALEAGGDRLDDLMGSGEVKDFPRDLVLLQGPLASTYGAGTRAYTRSLRAAVVVTDIDPRGRLRRRVDLIQETGWRSIAADPLKAWWHTLSATAELAVYESAFPTSTLGMLEDETLQILTRGTHSLDTDDEFLNRDHSRLLYRHSGNLKLGVPGVAGFFVVEPKTGAVFGLLPDGTRGSRNTSEEESLIAILSNVLAIMATVGKVGLVGGTALGVVAIYGKHLVRMYGAVSTAIATMDASDLDEEVEAALQSLACEITIAIFFAAGGKGLGAALNRLLKAVGLNPCAAL